MKYLNNYQLFESKSRLSVSEGSHGFNCEFKCDLGKGKALLMDNKSGINIPFEMLDDELFLFGIDTTPNNSGIGRLFLKEIFDKFKLSKVYLPSDENHPVWNKIATKTDMTITMGSKESTIFTLTKSQL